MLPRMTCVYHENAKGFRTARYYVNHQFEDGWERMAFPHIDPMNVHAVSFDGFIDWSGDGSDSVPYTLGLCRSGGLFTLYPEIDVNAEALAKAKRKLRSERDVVSLKVIRIHKTLEPNDES